MAAGSECTLIAQSGSPARNNNARDRQDVGCARGWAGGKAHEETIDQCIALVNPEENDAAGSKGLGFGFMATKRHEKTQKELGMSDF